MKRMILAFVMYLLNAVMYIATDDTTFGIWAIIFTVIIYGTAILEKLDEKADD